MKYRVVDIVAAALILDYPANIDHNSLLTQFHCILHAPLVEMKLAEAIHIVESLTNYLFLDQFLDHPTINFGVDMLQLLSQTEVVVTKNNFRDFYILTTVPYIYSEMEKRVEEKING